MQCVYCSNTTNLNTQLMIKLDDGTTATVQICDEHAEEATIKTAKEAYLVKLKQITELLAKAKEFGLELTSVKQEGKLIVPTFAQQPQQAPPVINEDIEGMVPIAALRNKDLKLASVEGQVGNEALESHTNYNLDIPEIDRSVGMVKRSVMEGRSGTPVVVDEIKIDATGTTRVVIKQVENDNKLQARFKKLADESMADRGGNFKSGYDQAQITCSMCNGSGFIKNKVNGVIKSIVCPKCSGAGILSKY